MILLLVHVMPPAGLYSPLWEAVTLSLLATKYGKTFVTPYNRSYIGQLPFDFTVKLALSTTSTLIGGDCENELVPIKKTIIVIKKTTILLTIWLYVSHP